MPRLTVQSSTHTVERGTRLVLAIEQAGIEIGHRCGGKARCTTCRVTFVAGEPEVATRAEHDKLATAGLLGEVRLSCQIVVDRDMEVVPLMTKDREGWADTGPRPADEVEPEPAWYPRDDLAREEPERRELAHDD